MTATGSSIPMKNENALRSLVAQFWTVDPTVVTDALLFDKSHIRNMSSIRFFRFIAAVESNLGVRLADPAAITSYGALRQALGFSAAEAPAVAQTAAAPSASAPPSAKPAPAPARPAPAVRPSAGAPSFALGHDIEEIASLPVTENYRADAFYTSNFTETEIAYCAASTNPRQHFAARFCAKEALRKCGALFASLNLRDIEVVNDPAGAPSIRILDQRVAAGLNGASLHVSLSHSPTLASAVIAMVRSN